MYFSKYKLKNIDDKAIYSVIIGENYKGNLAK